MIEVTTKGTKSTKVRNEELLQVHFLTLLTLRALRVLRG